MRDGRFDGDRSLEKGVNVCLCSPSSDRASLAQSTCRNFAEDCISKENILYAVGVHVMDVSMVIAAWGEGVGLSVSPSPLLDRS